MTDRLLTQEELEALMFDTGVGRMKASLEKAEEKGRAITNPYGQALLRDFVEPLASGLSNMLKVDRNTPGRHKAAVPVLEKLDPYVVVYLALRCAVNMLVGQESAPVSTLATAIARSVYGELVVAHLADSDPDLYRTLTISLTERLSKDDRHRLTVYRMQAAKNGIEVPEWSINLYVHVGQYVLTTLVAAGLVDIDYVEKMERGKNYTTARLHPDVAAKIAAIRQHVILAAPFFMPCAEAPRDWTSTFNGGWHTRRLSAHNHGSLVKAHRSSLALYRDHQMPVVFNAVNRMQRSAWKINQPILDLMIALSKSGCSQGEIVSTAMPPKPQRPDFLLEGEKDNSYMTEEQKAIFAQWKHEMRDYYTQRKLDGVRYARFRSCVTQAERFRNYPAIYFRYMADSRGRLYPMSTGLSPQGSDIQKAVLHAAEGKPLDTPDAIRWFHIHGANKWGFDKATLEERHQWVVDRQEQILAMAEDPMGNREWMQADSPMQFLAWALEYREWVNDRTGSFVNRIPVSMDGSCNGLQHLSAMMKDRIGGAATNLIPSERMNDIYKLVAEQMVRLMAAAREDDNEKESFRLRWLTIGANRSLVKRTVMTTPYGVTRVSATAYVKEWVRSEKPECFNVTEYDAASYYLMPFLWQAVGEVIVKGRLVMEWLQKSSRLIVKHMADTGELTVNEPVIRWVTPSGFLATQAHFKSDEVIVKTRLTRPVRITQRALEEDTPDTRAHAAAMAPNFIHSLDAAHLHMTIDALPVQIDFIACIHDDYGTLAADSQALYTAIREQFVRLYTDFRPLDQLRARYPFLPSPPEPGDLDIAEVLQSTYFFS